MAKREPLFADYLIAVARDPYLAEQPKTEADIIRLRNMFTRHVALSNALVTAKKFVLDDSAMRFYKDFLANAPDAIVLDQQFAIPPHNPTWVEFSVEILNGTPRPNEKGEITTRAGYLFWDGCVVRAMEDRDVNGAVIPMWGAFTYNLNKVEAPTELINMMHGKYDDTIMDGLLWGGSGGQNLVDETLKTRLKESHSLNNDSVKHARRVFENADDFFDSLGNSGGTVLKSLAILLLLNRTSPHQHITEVKAGQRIVQGKVSPMVKHSVVALKLNPDPKTIFHVPGDGVWRRQHDVRGHFCTNKRAKTSFCNGLHEWQEIKPHIWQCDRCKGLKWWRKEHKRGNADKGIVTQEYKVTAERKQS